MRLSPEHYAILSEGLKEFEKSILKSIPFILFSALLTTVKFIIQDPKPTWTQMLIGYIVGIGCGYLFGLATSSYAFCALGTLVGKDIINYIIVRFNKKNIDKTFDKFEDKF